MQNYHYYKWFRKLVDGYIFLFFIVSLLSNLFVYTSFINGIVKYVLFTLILVLFGTFVYFFREKIRETVNKCLSFLEQFSFTELLLILISISVFLKVFYTLFFFFDSTKAGSDISIYAGIADKIAQEGISSVNDQIYYLVGFGLHIAVFKKLSIPYHIGIYVFFLLATVINYFSFSRHISKEKSFLLLLLYLLMPSTCMLTFCITHELMVYFYFSLIHLLLSFFIESDSLKKSLVYAFLLSVGVVLNQTVSPMGKIWFIMLFIVMCLTNIDIKKRIILLLVILISFVSSDFVTTRLEANFNSQNNNYEQLLIGSDLETMGRHSDGKGKRAAEEYWKSKGYHLKSDNFIEGERGALIEQYKYLITHPTKLIELLLNKFYVAWSGDYYSIEYAHNMNSINDLVFYILLLISAVIWLFVISVGVFFADRKKESYITVYNYRIILLGVVSVLLITEIMNKYSCYMTAFIYFLAFERAGLIDSAKEN